MSKSKGILNRGSLVHKDKTKYSRKDKHDVLPCDDIPDTADKHSNRDDILDTELPHQD